MGGDHTVGVRAAYGEAGLGQTDRACGHVVIGGHQEDGQIHIHLGDGDHAHSAVLHTAGCQIKGRLLVCPGVGQSALPVGVDVFVVLPHGLIRSIGNMCFIVFKL